MYSIIRLLVIYGYRWYRVIGIYVCQLIQSIACYSLYDYGQYIRIALYKMQAYSRYRCIFWSAHDEPGVYIAIWV